jgi:hypothetical protein
MTKKVLLLWLSSELLFMLSFLLFDHEQVNVFTVINYSIQWLLFLLCLMIVRHEPNRKNKYIFLNFALFFSIAVFFHVYNFVGKTLFSEYQYARLYFNQYVFFCAYLFLLAFALAYLCLDALFREFKTAYKYALTLTIVGGFFVYYYSGYISNPKYLYTTNDAHTWKTLNESRERYVDCFGQEPSLETLSQISDLKLWKDGEPIGTLFPDEKLRVVTEFYPYLSGANYVILLQRPLYLNAVYMCVLCLGFILLFFGYQYMKDPPQGAYIDKIMFLFLIFCTMEIMHAWSFIKSVEWQSFYELAIIGQGLSLCILLVIAVFFGLRLKFIRSVKGEFYEQEILSSPGSVTRWRDALDDLLVAHFFNRKALLGRLFVSSSDKS